MTDHVFLPGPLDVERCFTCGERHEEKPMSEKPIGISDLVRQIGDDNSSIQNPLEEGTFLAANKRKGYTALEFATYPELAEEMFAGKVKRRIFVLLCDEDKVRAAMAALRYGR